MRTLSSLAGLASLLISLATAQTSSSMSSSATSATTLEPAPTFITTHENEFGLKITYFFVALIVFTVPACFACIFCFQRHQKRLKAVRSLQEAKRKGVKESEGGGNLAEGTGGTSALNVSMQSPSSPMSPGGKKGGFSGAAPLNESAHPNAGAAGPSAPGTFTIYDLSHTPPDQSLVPQNELFDKAPFHEDGAVLPDEIINGGGAALGGKAGGFGDSGDGDESLGLLGGGGKSGFGKSKNLMVDDTNTREDDGFGFSNEAAGGAFTKSKSGGGFKAFGSVADADDDDANPLEPQNDLNESSMDESKEVKGWGKNKGGRKAEW